MSIIHTERYEIDPLKIRRGGFGEVYAARDLLLDRDVVIKTIIQSRLYGLNEPAVRRHFFREAVVCAKLETPYIVKVLDYGYDRDSDAPFFVMESIDGYDLSTRIGNLSWKQAGELFCHAVAALSVAHAKGVIHSDISPDNILFDRRASIYKLTDFGVVKLLSSGFVPRVTLSLTGGKPQYIPPEHWCTGDRNEFTDLYALAVTIVELITGERPPYGFDFSAGKIVLPDEEKIFGPVSQDMVIFNSLYDTIEKGGINLGVENPEFDKKWRSQETFYRYWLHISQKDLMELLYLMLTRRITETQALVDNAQERVFARVLPIEAKWREEQNPIKKKGETKSTEDHKPGDKPAANS